ncbi:RHS repeat-associated core domain-containing protein [Photobacterium leiognathi]|uniref:RHS repeat-associated core domain-containing protein n=1 Tax=Photobacterium leiognathi TaxID=553611 RepID=UPI0029810A1B|nr:RHS repeat-associated core domain-containing protein [Photobacterium leiognathi]
MIKSTDTGRRAFLKQAVLTSGATSMGLLGQAVGLQHSVSPSTLLMLCPVGFNGEWRDTVTGGYHLGQGYRMYHPRLMRFHAYDSLSPFGRGGPHGYTYCLGDPINQRDPSGHFAILSLIIGAIIGSVVGAGISAAAEGIRAAATGDSFDWKQVGIGAALGFISGGLGAAVIGAKTSVQVGLALTDAVVSGAADFGLNVAAGTPMKQAGINAGIGAAVGLATFGIGNRVTHFRNVRRGNTRTIPGPVRPVNYSRYNVLINRHSHTLEKEIISMRDVISSNLGHVKKVTTPEQVMKITSNTNMLHKFVLSQSGEFSISSQISRGDISHAAIAATHDNQNVISAGLIGLRNDSRIVVSNHSGHYCPDFLDLRAIKEKIENEFRLPPVCRAESWVSFFQ